MVGRVGIEPTTGRLKAECSTSELTPRRDHEWYCCRRIDGGMIPHNLEITRLALRDGWRVSNALFVHALDTLSGQPSRCGFRVLSLHAGE